MRSQQEKAQEKAQKTTAEDQEKRFQLFKRLTSHSAEQFRDIDINDFDLNITENIETTEEIDSSVTPLIYAAYFGLKDITKILLRNRTVDVDLETENNRQTPLITACLCGNYEIVRLLLLAQAQVNKPNLLCQTPLAATLFRLVEEPASFENKKICFLIAELLVKHGADVNWVIDKKRGLTLLHYFCGLKVKMTKCQKQLNFQIVRWLLEKGADWAQLTLQDKTCQKLLQSHCNKEQMLDLLGSYKDRQPLRAVELRQIKKIDPNFFVVEAKK